MKSSFASRLGVIWSTILPDPQRDRKALALVILLALGVYAASNQGHAQTAHVTANRTAPSAQSVSQPHPLAAADFGSVNVGVGSSPITVTFTFDSAATIAAPSVVTQGAAGLDFADAGTGTCTTNGTTHTYSAGDTCTVDVTFTPKNPGTRYGAAVLRDNSGNVIATGYVQGTGIGSQVSFSPGMQSMLSLSGFTSPFAVAADSAGNLYIANAVLAYDPQNAVVKETWNGSGYKASTIATGLGWPSGLAVDGAGNVYIADQDNFTVYKETLALDGTYAQSIVDDTLGTVGGIAVDGSGNVYVGRGAIGVEKETLSGSTYTRSEIFYFATDAIAVDGAGNLYLDDLSHARVVKETPSGAGYTESIIASGFELLRFAMDTLGNIYFPNGSQIQKLTRTGGGYQQSTIVSAPNDPAAIAMDTLGNLYYSSYSSQTRDGNVWKVDYADPPSLTFATTSMGATGTDSPQTVTLANIGNADFTFPIPANGSNPALSPSFTLNDSAASACPQVSAGASSAGTLASGASCELSISFVPVSAGIINGSLVLTDNALNAASPNYATQTIALSGTATATKPAPSISVVSSAGSAFLSNPVTFTVTATNSAGIPTGTVTFNDGPNQLGTATLTAGAASYTTSSLAAGAHSITAAYSGDTTFSPVTSSAISQTIEDFSVTIPTGSSSSATVSPGGQASYILAIAASGGTSTAAAITLAVSGLPSTVTSSFSPSSVTANSASTNVTLKVTASSSASANPAKNSLFRNPVPIALGLLLTFSIGRIRRGTRNLTRILSVLVLGLVGMAGLATLAACGGSGSNSSGGGSTSTPQHYTITVTAASGSLSHATPLTLTVQ